MNKKINPSIAIAIILFATLIFAFFVLKTGKVEAPAEINNQAKVENNKISEEKMQTEDETNDWLDYKNYKYGYQVKFPRDWSVNDKNLANVYLFPQEMNKQINDLNEKVTLEIKILPVSKNQNIDILVSSVLAEEIKNGRKISKEEVLISGEKGFAVSDCGKFECVTQKWAVINGGYFYFLNSKNGLMPQFDKIFSTFKFIK